MFVLMRMRDDVERSSMSMQPIYRCRSNKDSMFLQDGSVGLVRRNIHLVLSGASFIIDTELDTGTSIVDMPPLYCLFTFYFVNSRQARQAVRILLP